ncbi:MAG: L-serine ammonia-lyase [Candidatus Omnitrophica bacterium]|nr:L-serine ammonia-lyase [Candidatus Omnitrophota bacterium]MDD5737788.1 L-serine ammonia-lyase [Candidatus Omnitrophota bacterium]
MKTINISIFDLFKIGPGPSSSHTIGPMKAAYDFLQAARGITEGKPAKPDRIEARLYGSLSATGEGHGTDQAVLAGLLGWRPEECDSDKFVGLFKDPAVKYSVNINNASVPFKQTDIMFDAVKHSFPYQNTMIIRLFAGKDVILEKEYYSTGGGFIKVKGAEEAKRGEPQYPYSNMSELARLVSGNKIDLADLVLANEGSIMGTKEDEVMKGVGNILSAMFESVERGLRTEGVLPGPIGLARKAPALYKRRDLPEHMYGRYTLLLSSYAMAAAEENAAHHRVVTAPTLGSAGVIPGVLYGLKEHFKISNRDLCRGLLAGAAVGFIIKHNASIAGAEVGCQGEIGAASSMAAAILAYISKRDIQRVAQAAAIALEHSLGWTCDPVGGYVQIPCIERNAMGAAHAATAYVLASAEDTENQKVGFDQVVAAMLETGRDMSSKYKETSEGGLAKCVVIC